jgi:hypothetical protein
MKELKEINDWIKSMDQSFHSIAKVSSLPNPVFICEGQEMVSFSSNHIQDPSNEAWKFIMQPTTMVVNHEGSHR